MFTFYFCESIPYMLLIDNYCCPNILTSLTSFYKQAAYCNTNYKVFNKNIINIVKHFNSQICLHRFVCNILYVMLFQWCCLFSKIYCSLFMN